MSSILPLARRLREMSEEELAELLNSLPQSSAGCADLFDLAKLMLGKRELEDRIRKLPAAEIANLEAGKPSTSLRRAFLADIKVFDEARDALVNIKQLTKPRLSTPASSLSAFETLLAITEIIFATEQHWLGTTKSGIKSADAKMLAEKFKWQAQDMQLRFRLAMRAELVIEQSGRWVASPKGQSWLAKNRLDAWVELATSCWDLPKMKITEESLTDQIHDEYPLIDLSKISLLEFGAALGLIDKDLPRKPMLGSSLTSSAKAISAELPKPENRLLVQGDLSIVCPGPIDAQLHRQLDSFADSEDLGLASRFRLSSLSISHHLECGGTINQIETTLAHASANDLPQPIRYLLSDTQERFGSLRVLAQVPTKIVSDDEILLTQIANEKSLVHLGLRRVSDGITTGESQELCYFSLRDCGYAAVMANEIGEIISPRFTPTIDEPAAGTKFLERAKSLLSGEKISAGQGEIQRQLQFALKNKLEVSLTFELDGTEQQMLLTPLGLAGNRLRGRDEAKQAERTVPLSRIRSVVLS